MREIMGFIIKLCIALLYMIAVTQAVSGVCTGDSCSDVVLMPLLNKELTATLTANLDVSLMNKYLRDYIRQEIKQGFEAAIKDFMEPMVDNKTEKAIENMKAEIDGKTAQLKVEIDAMIEKSKQAVVTIEARFKDTKTETDTYISRKITEFESIFERKDRPKFAFFAYLSSSRSDLSDNSVVVFDVVPLNIGSSYSGTTGKFTCLESGVYTFSWTTLSAGYRDFTSSLVIDGHEVANNVVDNDRVSNDLTGSSTAVVHLWKEQTVWIKVYNNGKYIYGGAPWSFFSGFKIY